MLLTGMNVNVIVMNMYGDFRTSEMANREKKREQWSGSSASNPRAGATDQVIELVSQDGAWVGKSSARASRVPISRGQNISLSACNVMIYDQAGKARYTSYEKGFRINITV